MSVLAAALISFFGFVLLASHFERSTMRRICGYAMWVDLTLHVSVIYLFMGTSTLGLMQAELSAIMFTISLRVYRWLFGFERFENLRWVRYTGVLAKS